MGFGGVAKTLSLLPPVSSWQPTSEVWPGVNNHPQQHGLFGAVLTPRVAGTLQAPHTGPAQPRADFPACFGGKKGLLSELSVPVKTSVPL